MINLIKKILSTSDFYGISEEIDIAKGKNKIPKKMSEGLKQIKRELWLKK